MSPEQQLEQGGRVLPTKSRAWHCLEVVRSRLSSRLANFTRDWTVDGRGRPQRRDNNAAFFETDLRHAFQITPIVETLSLADYTDMDLKATGLLESLNELVSDDFIDTEDEQGPEGWESESNEDVSVPCDIKMLGGDYPRLRALIIFLEDSEGMLNLAIGPGSPIFALSPDAVGELALDRVTKWKELLERLMANPRRSHGLQLSMPQTQSSAEWTETQPGVPEKSASVVVGAMFKELRRLSCVNGDRTHEIKLKVPKDLYTGPVRQELDVLVSCCFDKGNEVTKWQEAACGTVAISPDVDMCSAIKQAQRNNTKLYLFVNQEHGLLSTSDKGPLAPSAAHKLELKSLNQLLQDKLFDEGKYNNFLQGKKERKFGVHQKAVLALSLARCLMDFIDEELELASNSWNAQQIFFQYPESTTTSDGTFYISLKPKTARQQSPVVPVANLIYPGSPVLLSFTRLLLEIYDGEVIPLDINNDTRFDVYGRMCQALQHAEGVRGKNYFSTAVQECLRLHVRLEDRMDKMGGAVHHATASDLRLVMNEYIVQNLELMVNPDSTKRKRARDPDSTADLPPQKRVLALSSGVTNPKAASDTQLFLRCAEDDKCSPLSASVVDQHIRKKNPAMKWLSSGKQALVSANLVQRDAIPTISPVEGLMRSPDTVTLYDDRISWEDPKDPKLAETYFSRLDGIRDTFIRPLRDRTMETEDERLRRPVRIAILDSGVDMLDPYVNGAKKRIKAKRNWTDHDLDNWGDTYGHGTHVARLVIRVAPAAEIYIARVSTAKEIEPENTGRVAEAINYAATEWNVDIISLSLGLEKDHQEIDRELEQVLFPNPGDGRKRIVIAAAANWAGNQDIAYPARRQNVICIHATDGGGNPSKYNPTARKGHKHNFALLGSSIESRWRVKEDDSRKLASRERGKGALAGTEGPAAAAGLIKPKPKREKVWISGTSYATPIAAGIAANVLEFARHHAKLTPGEWEGLYSGSGMSRIFKAMSDERQHYDYIRPWMMFNTERDPEMIVKSIRKILNE